MQKAKEEAYKFNARERHAKPPTAYNQCSYFQLTFLLSSRVAKFWVETFLEILREAGIWEAKGLVNLSGV